jgi:hypothetical protein
MALTIAQVRKSVPGDTFELSNNITGDANYPAPGVGYTITPQQLGYASQIRRIIGYDPLNFASAAVLAVFSATYVNGIITSIKFQIQVFATGAEIAAATNVSGYTFTLITEGL